MKKHSILFSPKLNIMEDTYFYIQLLGKENIYFYDKVIYNYVENENSVSRDIKKAKEIYIEMLKAEQHIVDELKKNNFWSNEIRNIIIKKIIINGISNCTWNLYKAREKKQLKDFLRYIDNNKNIRFAFKIMDINGIRIDKKIVIKLIKNKHYKILYAFYKLKYIIYSLMKRRKV